MKKAAGAVAIAVASVVMSAGVAAQTANYHPRRLPDGQPDIQGAYTGPDSAVNLDRTAAGFEVGGRPPAYDNVWAHDRPGGTEGNRIPGPQIVDPVDRVMPYQPWAREKKNELLRAYILDRNGDVSNIDPMVRCVPQGPPRSNMFLSYNGYYFVQPPGHVLILSETNHVYRIISVDGRPHLTPKVRLYRGDSRGRWEGGTLVVETTNNVGGGWFDMVGSFYTDALRVLERYTISSPKRIDYEATIEDPGAFTRPWQLASFFDRADERYEIYEYACHEGNDTVKTLMRR
jgi:hypothetical protein